MWVFALFWPAATAIVDDDDDAKVCFWFAVVVISLPLFQSQFVSLSERDFRAAASIRSPFVRFVSLFMSKF